MNLSKDEKLKIIKTFMDQEPKYKILLATQSNTPNGIFNVLNRSHMLFTYKRFFGYSLALQKFIEFRKDRYNFSKIKNRVVIVLSREEKLKIIKDFIKNEPRYKMLLRTQALSPVGVLRSLLTFSIFEDFLEVYGFTLAFNKFIAYRKEVKIKYL